MTAPDLFPAPTAASLAELDAIAEEAMRRADASPDPFYRARADALVRQADAVRRQIARAG